MAERYEHNRHGRDGPHSPPVRGDQSAPRGNLRTKPWGDSHSEPHVPASCCDEGAEGVRHAHHRRGGCVGPRGLVVRVRVDDAIVSVTLELRRAPQPGSGPLHPVRWAWQQAHLADHEASLPRALAAALAEPPEHWRKLLQSDRREQVWRQVFQPLVDELVEEFLSLNPRVPRAQEGRTTM